MVTGSVTKVLKTEMQFFVFLPRDPRSTLAGIRHCLLYFFPGYEILEKCFWKQMSAIDQTHQYNIPDDTDDTSESNNIPFSN